MTESHGQGPLTDLLQRQFTMACFLVAAGNFSYYSYASWTKNAAWSLAGTRWWPEYDLPLGQPLDPPMMAAGDGNPMSYTRRFESGTAVKVDLVAHTATINWGSPSVISTFPTEGVKGHG
jgi:hypothetical protein